ncbi:MAG: hypothetical protein LBC41_17110 [Clostridiales bacterium]|jgi:hypothetical protein|nr:hypothetical protein [Clostridiales bacterium]MDR2752378.1 hypothetical protein [Clostridiales bacterium]
MFLKESFRYQNFLDRLISTAASCLEEDRYVTTTKALHYKKQADQNAKDETVDTIAERPFGCSVNELIDFYVSLTDEKEALTFAIGKAKAECGVDIDSALALNRLRHDAAEAMSRLAGLKSRELDTTGRDFRINNEGNQTPYVYKIKEVITIDFDRNKPKSLAKSLLKKSDEISAQVDRLFLSVEVGYEPKYDINDKFEDALEEFLSAQGGHASEL